MARRSPCLSALLVLLAGAGAGAAAAADSTVRCTCPTVRADGFGSTACSANESASRCRVEFNQFPDEAVQAAATALRQSGETLVPLLRGRDEDASEFYSRLAALEEEPRARAVLVYVGVAAARDERWDKARVDALVNVVLRDAPTRRRVAEAFSREAMAAAASGRPFPAAGDAAKRTNGGYGAGHDEADISKRLYGGRRDEVDIAPGCVAVKAGADWYMYKAPWSSSRTLPQCSAR
jgi:hypothetical protein